MTDPVVRTLLVDDEPAILDVQRLMLEANGFFCEMATDGFEALGVLRKSPVDVVISDLMMPNILGFELRALPKLTSPNYQIAFDSSRWDLL